MTDPASGKVFFIGAGPGDPELITLKGARIVRTADRILYAGSLVPEEIFADARADAERFNTESLGAVLPPAGSATKKNRFSDSLSHNAYPRVKAAAFRLGSHR